MADTAIIPISTARIPQTYANAKSALNSCLTIDECKDWSDKAAALASYAKQAGDDTLMNMAARIKGRAIRRAGELLKHVEPGNGARDGKREEGAHPPLRSEMAKTAGMSTHQAKQAVRVANVPAEEFEKLVEAERPPTVTKLAEIGTKSKYDPVTEKMMAGRDESTFQRSLHFVAAFARFLGAVGEYDIEATLPGLIKEERTELRSHIEQIDALLRTIKRISP